MPQRLEDEHEFSALEEYLGRLQAGECPDRKTLVEAHPDLGSVLGCLEALERLAPPRESTGGSEVVQTPSKAGPLHSFGAYEILDSILLLAVLLIADGVASPLVVGYLLLIAGSGLWFRVRFVWFMTALSLISYSVLVAEFYYWQPNLQAGFDPAFDRHIVFIVGMLVTAGVVAYLVDRVRALSSYFGQRV